MSVLLPATSARIHGKGRVGGEEDRRAGAGWLGAGQAGETPQMLVAAVVLVAAVTLVRYARSELWPPAMRHGALATAPMPAPRLEASCGFATCSCSYCGRKTSQMASRVTWVDQHAPRVTLDCMVGRASKVGLRLGAKDIWDIVREHTTRQLLVKV